MTETTRQHLAWLAGALALGWGLGVITSPRINTAAAMAYLTQLDAAQTVRMHNEVAYRQAQFDQRAAGIQHALDGCAWRLIAAGVEP